MFKKLMSKEKLFLRVFIMFVLGIAFGFALPKAALDTAWIGTIFMNLIRLMIVPVVFCSVVSGISHLENAATLKRMGLKIVVIYVVFTLLSCFLSLGIAYLVKPGVGVSFENLGEVATEIQAVDPLGFFKNLVPTNMVAAFSTGDVMQVILIAVFIGVALVLVGEAGKPVTQFVSSLSKVLYKIMDGIMSVSPIGVFFLMGHATAYYGPQLFTSISKFIGNIWLSCILIFLLIFTLPVLIYTKLDFKTWIKGLIPVFLVTFSTNSSAASIPTTLRVTTDTFKVPDKLAGFSIPLGATINLCGGACFMVTFTVFVSQFYGITMPFGQLLYVCLMATLLSIAAPGIPGGGIVLGPVFLSMVGLPMDLGGLLAGFYRLIDTAHTATNVSGDVAGTLIVAKSEKIWDKSMLTKTE